MAGNPSRREHVVTHEGHVMAQRYRVKVASKVPSYFSPCSCGKMAALVYLTASPCSI